MKGGLTFYRGSGKEARNYIEADHHTPRRADEYYLAEGHGIAPMTRINRTDGVVERVMLDGDTYQRWVEGTDIRTGQPKGKVIAGGEERKALRFCEININCPKSLSLVAAIHPDISDALDLAQDAAAEELNAVLIDTVTTRVGPQGEQQQVHVDEIEVVSVAHQTSRAGDPHRHIHHQVNARVLVDGTYRGLDSKAMLRMTRMLNGVGARAILAHPELRRTLAAHGYTLTDKGEVTQLAQYVPAMSKRATQVERNLARYERDWRALFPGEEPGPVIRQDWKRAAWNDGRQAKNKRRLAMPGHLVDQEWRAELESLGLDITALHTAEPVDIQGPLPGQVDRDEIAARALAVLGTGANGRSTWNVYDVRGAVEETLTRRLVHGDTAALTELAEDVTARVLDQCLSTDPGRRTELPEHIRHLTSQAVIDLENDIAGRLAGRATEGHTDHQQPVQVQLIDGLDAGQLAAVRALAGTGQVVMVEGAAGAGKTTMLGAAAAVLASEGNGLRVLAPSRKAAMLAAAEIGEVEANTVHGLVYAHGYRWDTDGVWTRLQPGDVDPVTGRVYHGPGADARLLAGHLLVIDEAGMLDQECARAVLTVADEATARVGFIGDRRQLPAIGRGGVLDMVAAWAPAQVEMTAVHRFRQRVETEPGGPLEDIADKDYAKLSLRMRNGKNPGKVFDQLAAAGRVVVHPAEVDTLALVAISAAEVAARGGSQTVAVSTNEAADHINLAVRDILIARGLVDDEHTVVAADGIRIGVGDLVQTRVNDRDLGVMNRETWTVTTIHQDGSIRLRNETNRNRFAELPEQYCRDSVQHAWAQTIHGAQGSTADHGVLLLSDATDATAAYVGMTRGKYSNTVHIVAANQADAKAQWVAAANRGRADLGLDHAAKAAGVESADYATPSQRLRAVVDRITTVRDRPYARVSDRELASQAAAWHTHQAQALAGKQGAERFIRTHGDDITAGQGPAMVKAQQQVAELRDRTAQAQAAHRAHQLQEQARRSALQITAKERQLQATTGLFTGKQRKAVNAELDELRTIHAERETAAAAAAAPVPPGQPVSVRDLSTQRTEETAARMLENAARTDNATLRVRQQGLARYTTQIHESVTPLEQIHTELEARAKDPSLSVPDDPKVLAHKAAQQLHTRNPAYDYDPPAPRHDRGISI